MKIERVDIGRSIRERVVENGISNAAFARMINIQRQNVEKTVFSKNSIDTDLLILISDVLDYNFFQLYQPEEDCNKKDYSQREVKATLTVEFGEKKQDRTFKFLFGDNNIEIVDNKINDH